MGGKHSDSEAGGLLLQLLEQGGWAPSVVGCAAGVRVTLSRGFTRLTSEAPDVASALGELAKEALIRGQRARRIELFECRGCGQQLFTEPGRTCRCGTSWWRRAAA